MKQLNIISRNSKLAMWQATHVQNLLQQCYPAMQVNIIGITTEGDRILDRALDKIGGKGLFIKELEHQLIAGTADIAVHSLKDLPANIVAGFALGAILPRENPFDAFVSNTYASLQQLPDGAVVGTSSSRRVAFLKQNYPHLKVKLLRGNLQTRLAKLDAGDYDGIILAVAGLKRLGLANRITQILNDGSFIPAIGQGTLAIEILATRVELIELLKPLHDELAACQVGAEREMGRKMMASCNIPVAGYATLAGDSLTLNGFIGDAETSEFLIASVSGLCQNYLEIGRECADKLMQQGAKAIIDKYAY
jgi:hydroxymethylbilane synthase